MNNHRSHPRIQKNLLVVVAGRLGAVIRNTIDISENGLKLDPADAVFALGQQVRLTLGSAGESVVTVARVVRSDDNSVALRFEHALDSNELAEVLAA